MNRAFTRRTLAFLCLAVSSSACATIIHGTSQGIGFSSSPSGANVFVDGKPVGATPAVVKLARNKNHLVRMELAGYQPYETTVTHSVSGWVVGNLVFGLLPGLIVDAVSGGIYQLKPEQVVGQLTTKSASTRSNIGEGLFVAVVLEVDPSWTKVGQLARR